MTLWHTCFPVNFAEFLRPPFLQSTSGRLLLKTVKSQKEEKQKGMIYFQILEIFGNFEIDFSFKLKRSL